MLRYALISLPLLLTSCQVKSPDSLLGEVKDLPPSSWSASKEASYGIDAQWINRFKDQTLKNLVAEGLKNNPGLRVAEHRLIQAQKRADLEGASTRPQLNLGLSGTRQQTQFVGFNFPGSENGNLFDNFGVNLNASWELDVWGRIRAAQSAQAAAYEGQYWDIRGAEASLQAQIAKAYFSLVEAETQITLAEESHRILLQTRDAISERYARALTDEGGTASQYRLAQSDAKNAEAEISRWKGLRDRAARQLELLIGRYPAGTINREKKLPELGSTPPVGLPSQLLLRRPDILSAERRYAESVERKKEANRAVFPTISLTGSTGTNTAELSNILNSSFGVWSIGGAITQAILSGGVVQTERVIRKEESKARLIELQDTVIGAMGEVETALAAERFLRERLQHTEEALTLTKEANESSRLEYAEGITPLQTVLNAEARYIQTASALTTLKRLMLENRIDLHLALGGDFFPTHK